MKRMVSWVKGALKEFRAFPRAVQEDMPDALEIAAFGEMAGSAKPMKGLGSGVFEIAVVHRGNAYRAVYSVGHDVWVVHAFQKKATRGIDVLEGYRPDPAAAPAVKGDARMTGDIEVVVGSGNVYQDLALSDAETRLLKAELAAEIIRILRERDLTQMRAAKLVNVPQADLSRIKNGKLRGISVERLLDILGRFNRGVRVKFVDLERTEAA
jgi:phage-related protein/predicted XRE-type DNA-binding protein